MNFIAFLMAATVSVASPMPAATAAAMSTAGDKVYAWCHVSQPDYGRYYYISTVFQLEPGIYSVGIQNSFISHISANWENKVTSPLCHNNYDSYQEAEDAKNDFVSSLRSSGVEVQTVRWTYYGD